MKKRNALYIFSLLSILLFANYTVIKVAGSHPGSTGAPLDLTCGQMGCHTDAQVIPNAVNNNTLIFGSPDSSYTPGTTYNMTVMVQGSGFANIQRFGFEIGVLKDNDSLNVGAFNITDVTPLRTQIITHPIGSDLRYSITHKTAGTPSISTNLDRWTFSWTAPPVNEGKITFWYATIAADNDGTQFGDRIYLHSFTIHPSNISSIKEIADLFGVATSFDYTNNEIIIKYDLKGTRNVQACIYDMSGKQVYNGPTVKLKGAQKQNISLSPNFSKGTYIIQLNIDNAKATRKLLIN